MNDDANVLTNSPLAFLCGRQEQQRRIFPLLFSKYSTVCAIYLRGHKAARPVTAPPRADWLAACSSLLCAHTEQEAALICCLEKI